MTEGSLVVVFPSIFAKNKQTALIDNIKKILKIQNQQFVQIARDDELVIIEANDPVFASSAVNMLFGIERVAIARRVENKFDLVVSAIAKVGASLLLRGEQFFVKVEGRSTGYLPKDVEVAATASLIDKLSGMDCKPGTEERHDKLIYCYLTKKNAYVSIFTDKGHGGIPYNSHNEKIVCCIYDELSAISCLESIKQGFDAKISICYTNEANLLELVKIVNRILPRTLTPQVSLDFFALGAKDTPRSSQLRIITASEIACFVAKQHKIRRVSLPLSPLVFPIWFIEKNLQIVNKNKLVPWIPLSGIGDEILFTAKEIGLGKYLHRLERLGLAKFVKSHLDASKLVKEAIRSRQTITVKLGPNNIHDILDALKH
ncbi:MAG: thiamine biosynthesis protein [Nitrososphaera sp.]|jgi:adenylyl- and sulfurtransferase ThiI